MAGKILEVDPSTFSYSSELILPLRGVAAYIGETIGCLESAGIITHIETSRNFRPFRISSRRLSFPQPSSFDGAQVSRLVARIDAQGNAMLASAPVWDPTFETPIYSEIYIPGDDLLDRLNKTPACLWDEREHATAYVHNKIIYPFCSYLYRETYPSLYITTLAKLIKDLTVLSKLPAHG